MSSELTDVDRATLAQRQRRMTGDKQINRRDRMAREAMVVGLYCMQQILPEVDLAALQHFPDAGPTRHFDQFHLNLGIAFGVVVPEIRNDTFDELRRGR